MPQRLEKLRTAISELEAELAAVDSVDEPTRQMLVEAMSEISDTLQRQPAEPLEEPHPVRSRLQSAAEEFESSHPTLAGILSRLVNSLGQLGI